MEHVEFLKKIVLEAASLITDDFEVNSKGDSYDVVTNFDYAVEKYLIEKMNEHYPTFTVVSEEFNTTSEQTDNCFIIDPIDGTINFANKIPLWGIQVACKKDGKTCAAVIYLVKQNELFWADETGAYLNGEKISVRKYKHIKNAIYTLNGNKADIVHQKIKNQAFSRRILGACCVCYAYVACGRLSGEFFGNNSAWDYEPGMYIAKQAGAYIIDRKDTHIAACTEEFAKLMDLESDFN